MCKSSVFLETDANTQNALAELSTGEMFAKSVMLFLSTSVSWPESDRRTPLRWLIETYWLMPQVARDGCKPFFWSILKNMLLFYYIMYFFLPKSVVEVFREMQHTIQWCSYLLKNREYCDQKADVLPYQQDFPRDLWGNRIQPFCSRRPFHQSPYHYCCKGNALCTVCINLCTSWDTN